MKHDKTLWVRIVGGARTIIAQPEIRREDGSMASASSYNRGGGEEDLSGLSMVYRVSRFQPSDYPGDGWDKRTYDTTQVSYEAYSLDVFTAKKVLATLSAVQAAQDRMIKGEGSPVGPAQEIWRFVRAVGAAGIVYLVDGNNRFEFDARRAQYIIDDLEAACVKVQKGGVA